MAIVNGPSSVRARPRAPSISRRPSSCLPLRWRAMRQPAVDLDPQVGVGDVGQKVLAAPRRPAACRPARCCAPAASSPRTDGDAAQAQVGGGGDHRLRRPLAEPEEVLAQGPGRLQVAAGPGVAEQAPERAQEAVLVLDLPAQLGRPGPRGGRLGDGDPLDQAEQGGEAVLDVELVAVPLPTGRHRGHQLQRPVQVALGHVVEPGRPGPPPTPVRRRRRPARGRSPVPPRTGGGPPRWPAPARPPTCLEGVGHQPVEAGPAQRVRVLVDGLLHQGVGELEPLDGGRLLAGPHRRRRPRRPGRGRRRARCRRPRPRPGGRSPGRPRRRRSGAVGWRAGSRATRRRTTWRTAHGTPAADAASTVRLFSATRSRVSSPTKKGLPAARAQTAATTLVAGPRTPASFRTNCATSSSRQPVEGDVAAGREGGPAWRAGSVSRSSGAGSTSR